MNEEKLRELSKKYNLPEEQIKLIIRSFNDGLRHYLSHPLEAKGGIMIHNLVTFYTNEKRVKREIERMKLKEFKNKPKVLEESIDFHYKLLETATKYERQKSKIISDQQSIGGTSQSE